MHTHRSPHSGVPSHTEHADRRTRARRGFTLVELVVVLLIVVAVAAVGALSVSTIAAQAPRDVTQVSLAEVREALAAYRADNGALPATLDELFARPASAPVFDTATRRGWRGPYLASSSVRYVVHPIDAIRGDEDGDDGFTAHYAPVGAPVPADGWTRSIVLQYPDIDDDGVLSATEREHVRLVSAGDDGRIRTPRTAAEALPPGNVLFPTLNQCDDDVVLYLRVVDARVRVP